MKEDFDITPEKENSIQGDYAPKFMEWGVINKENFSSVKDVPIKRWDPLSTVYITSKDFGYREERQRFYGHYSYLSPIRGKRPIISKAKDEQNYESGECSNSVWKDYKDVFMSILEGKQIYSDWGGPIGDGFTLIITENEKRRDNPFLDKPHRIEKIPDSCKAITLINRYPSMARVVDPEVKSAIEKLLPLKSKLAEGINLISISRRFYPSSCFNLIPEDILAAIFLSMKAAILYAIEEAIERDYYDIPVNSFFNIGSKVGGSQPRIHSQVYIDLSGDGHGSRLEGYLRAFKEMGDQCHLCKSTHDDNRRIILDTDYWTFFTTGSPVRNYHIRFIPKEHIRRFTQLNVNQISDLARILKILFQALDDLEIDKNRNILFNCCPYGYDANFHMFGDIIPHEIIGGAEMADDMRVARKSPNDTAEEIRNAISS